MVSTSCSLLHTTEQVGDSADGVKEKKDKYSLVTSAAGG